MSRNLLERAIRGAMELVGQLAQILDQSVALLRKLIDVGAHLRAIAVGLAAEARRLAPWPPHEAGLPRRGPG